jgi:hypothetical protein
MRQKNLLLLMIMNITVFNLFAQPSIQTQKVIGANNYDELRSMYVTKDGGMIVLGQSYSNKSGEKTQNIRGENDYWIVKLDKHQRIEWDRTLGGIGSEIAKSVIQTTDGGYALVGESSSYTSVEKDEDGRGSSDLWFVKLDRYGNIQWNKTIGGNGTDLVDNVVQTNDGGYVLVGSSDSYRSFEKSEDSRGVFDFWVVKLDKKGNIQWDKTLGGYDYEFGSGVDLTSDGGIIVSGFSQSNMSGEKTENSRGGFDYWVVKLDMNGNKQWDKTIGGDGGDFCRGVKETADGYLLSGNSNSNISGEKTENGRGGYDQWIVKIDKNGQVQKDKTIGGDGDDADSWNLEKTSDGGFIFGCGSTSNISGEKTENSRGLTDYWVIKLDAQLNIEWDKTIGGDSWDGVFSVKEVEKNLYAVGGVSLSGVSGDKNEPSRGNGDYWIVWLSDKNKVTKNDVNENQSTFKSTQANEVAEKAIFAVYPNPARSTVNIQLKGKAIITLTDQLGKTILTKQIENTGSISVSSLPKGIYYIKSNQSADVQKVVVTK